MKKLLQNIGVSLGALLLCLLVCEGVVRTVFGLVPNYDFEMWRYAVEFKQPLPTAELPFRHRPGKTGNFYGVTISTNSFGARGPEVPLAKPTGRKRILFLGDSYTLGWGVPFDATVPRRLEQLLSSEKGTPQVVNLGVGNYNSTMEVELFKRQGLALNPDLVVLMYYINDAEELPVLSGFSYWLQKHFYLAGYVRTKLRQLAMMGEGSDWLSAYYRKLYSSGTAGLQKNEKSLRELVSLCRSSNVGLLIVNIPDLRRLENYPFTYATSYIRAIAEEGQLPFLDLLPVYERYPGRALWVSDEDSHANGLANRLAGEAIAAKIRDEGLLDNR